MKSDGFIIPAGRCELCPRRCAAERFGGSARGWCGAADAPRVFRWGPHFGEEPPLVEGGGSGCVFFSRCTMKCLYCQNSPWSWKGGGKDKTIAELTDIFRELAVEDKCANWNLVSPTPYLPFIREAVAPLLAEGIRLPFVWNSSGYERVETLEEYSDLCDWALFDLRYSRDETAVSLSQAPGYVAASRAAVKWAWEKEKLKVGKLKVESGKLKAGQGGLIVRILVLPGHADEAIENLAWLATEVSNEVAVSVMAQYTPAYKALETPPLDRSVTKDEYESVVEAAADFGFENGWIQGYEASDAKLALLGENMGEDHGSVK
ncbi:MAG: radical SAM protein [Kiritimatiellae bacterium]|nr:radical SAM protein [Kiritimatiellia bacterium]